MRTVKEESVPQARNLESVVAVVLGVHQGIETAEEAARVINMVERQGYYYLSAARFLGLVYREGKSNFSTDLGNTFATASDADRTALLTALVDDAIKSAYDRMDEVKDETLEYRLGTLLAWSEQTKSVNYAALSTTLTAEIEKVRAERAAAASASSAPRQGETCTECWMVKSLSGECAC